VRSAALLEARRRGAQPFPVLTVDWQTRALSLGRDVIAPTGRLTAAGQVTRTSQPGSWAPIQYGPEGPGIEDNVLEAVKASVGIVDPRRELIDMLETYDPRGSVAAIDVAAPDLVVADWEPQFRGVVEDWTREGLVTKVLLKTDDTVLRTPVPPGVFRRIEWSAASDGSIFGTQLPLLSGIHDGADITARGMVPAVNLRYDKTLGYWWLASANLLVDVTRIYYDGIPQSSQGWSTLRGVFGGNQMTIIVIGEGSQPVEEAIVSFDCKGPDATGFHAGLPVTGPIEQLRMVLEEYVYRPAPLALWWGPHPIIDATSWDYAEAWFAARGYECARRFGGDQNAESAAEVIQSFLDAHSWARIFWTPLGTLGFAIIDPDDVDPDPDAVLDLEKYHAQAGELLYEPGDRREVYTQVKMPYMWSSAEQKFLTAYEAHDVAALPEKVVLQVENVWTQGRYLAGQSASLGGRAGAVAAVRAPTWDPLAILAGRTAAAAAARAATASIT